jgi:O-antigen/teichoic acid export membrane protein
MVYLTKGGFWVTTKRIVSIISGLSLSVAFANLLSQETYGNYKFVLSLASIIGIISLSGINTATTQSVARGFEGTVKLALRASLKWSSGMVIIALIGSIYYYLSDNLFLGTSLLIVAVALPIINSFGVYSSLLKGRKEFRLNTIYSIPQTLIPAVALVVTLLLTKTPLTLVFVYFTSNVVATVGMYLFTMIRNRPNDLSDTKSLSFSKHLSLMNLFVRASKEIDKVLLFHFLGASPVAVYSLAVAPVQEIGNIESSILSPAFPKLSQRPIEDLKKSLPRRMVILFLFLIPVVFTYIMLAPFLFQTLFPLYMEAVTYSQVAVLVILFMPFEVIMQTFNAHAKKRELYILKTVIPVLRVIMLLTLVPFYGIWGVIITLLAANVVHSFIALYLFKKL